MAASAAVPGSKSCGSTAAEETIVVTVAHAPPSCRTRSPHWPTDTATSTTRPGQAAGSPWETAPVAAPAEHAGSASAARAARAATVRGTTAELLVTDNDSQNQYARGARPAVHGISGTC